MSTLHDSLQSLPRYRAGLDELGRPAMVREKDVCWVDICAVLSRADKHEASADPAELLKLARHRLLASGGLSPDIVEALEAIRDAEHLIKQHEQWAEAARPRTGT